MLSAAHEIRNLIWHGEIYGYVSWTCFSACSSLQRLLISCVVIRAQICYRPTIWHKTRDLRHNGCGHPSCRAVGKDGKGIAGFLDNALVRAAPGDLQAAALEAILEVAAAAPADFAGGYRAKAPWLQGFLSHVSPTGQPQHPTVQRRTSTPRYSSLCLLITQTEFG